MLRYDPATDDRLIFPRNPWPNSPRPLSNFYNGAASVVENQEVGQDWSPTGTRETIPYRAPEDRESFMDHPQADFYDASPNAFPNNGQWDKPNGYFANLIRLKPHTSAHPGKSNPTGAGPTMYFHAPPVFSLQTKPIPAVGV
jgi:hypothetical protein